MALKTTVWNAVTTDTQQPATVNGQSGWWTVPRHWYCRSFAGGTNQWEVCEKSDFSGSVFIAVIGDDGITRVYQDLLRNKMAGNDR